MCLFHAAFIRRISLENRIISIISQEECVMAETIQIQTGPYLKSPRKCPRQSNP